MATNQSKVSVKLEPESETVECPEGLHVKSEYPDNDAEFVVKEEIEIGCHVLQPPDISFMLMDVKEEKGADNIDRNIVTRPERSSGSHITSEEVSSVHNSEPLKKKYICGLCPSTIEYKSYAWLRKHCYNIHLVNMPERENKECYIGNICNITIEGKHSLFTHLNTKHGSKMYMCDICKRYFKRKIDLIDHFKNMCKTYTKKSGKFICNECNKCLKNKQNLLEHITHIHLSKPESCKFCKKSFLNMRYLKTHIDFIHLRKRNKQCPICKKKFISQIRFDIHKEKCEISLSFPTLKVSTAPVRTRCQICQKVCNDKTCLSDHIRRFHRKRDHDRKCNICDILLFSKSSLKRHLNSKHLVKTLSNNMHQFNQRLKCNLCGNSYIGDRGLTRHLKRSHLTLHRYSCACCSSSFKKRCEMIDHLNTCSYYDVK